MSEFLHQYFYLLDKNTRKKLVGLLLLFITSSLLDVLGIGLVGVFLTLIMNPVTLSQYTQYIPFHQYIHLPEAPNQFIIGTGIIIILAFIFKATLACFVQSRITSFSYSYALTLKMRLMDSFQRAPYTYHLKKNSAYLTNHLQQVDGYASGILIASLTLTANLIIAFAITLLILISHPLTTMILSGVFAFIFLINNGLLKEKMSALGSTCASAAGHINKDILHALKGIKEIRILGKEAFFLNRIHAVSAAFAMAHRTRALYLQLPRNFIEATLATFIILLCIGSIMTGMTSAEVISFVGLFTVAGARLMPTMNQLTAGINDLRFNAQTMKRIYEEFKLLEQLNQHAIPMATTRKLPFNTISLQNITYLYPQGKQSALTHINFNIKKGQSIGLIGTSGAGKSTLVNLLLGFLQPQQGQILVDNQPIANVREWLNNFAYIPQHIFLLDDSLKHNIALGVEDEHIDPVRMLHAIQMAQLEQVVASLPDGQDTLLGENGVRLSGGQRQRVALARTFYHDRDIIVMDEATSALDNETEHEIINCIKRLHGVKTLIVIAHRLSTIAYCDVIYKMEKGQIVQTGSFQEVVGNKHIRYIDSNDLVENS